jgi:hypothetical protein
MFLKWLIDHWTEQLKHANVMVSHTFLYLILLSMFFIGSVLKGVLDGKPEAPATQQPVVVIVQHDMVSRPKTSKRRRGRQRRPIVKKSRTN